MHTITTHNLSSGTSVLKVNGNTYPIPSGVVRVALEQIIDLAECGLDFSSIRQDVSVANRSAEAMLMLTDTLGLDDNDAIRAVVQEHVAKLGGGAVGARECYANLVALQGYLGLFFPDLSRMFLCADHQELADAQEALAVNYANDHVVSDDVTGMAESLTRALDDFQKANELFRQLFAPSPQRKA